MDVKDIEYLHNTGKMPDWAYYQQNGKTAQENFRDQRINFLDSDLKIQEILESKLEDVIDKALNSVLEKINK